jgi:ABC-type multidrug transport system permease subunit
LNSTYLLFQLGLGSFYPNFLLSGIIWPIEGMPVILQYLALLLPQTYACEAMRSVLSRGWSIAWYISLLITKLNKLFVCTLQMHTT